MGDALTNRPGKPLVRTGVGRRRFLACAAATAGAALWAGRAGASEPLGAGSLVEGKDPRLIVHAHRPAVFETPAELLLDQPVTPTPLLFVRNNQQLAAAATLKPLVLAGWKIELGGLVDRPQTIGAAELAEMQQVEHEMVLQCSGSGRTLFGASAPVKGTSWGRGGMGNVVFGGVPLAAVVDRLGLKIKSEAIYLTAEGRDEPEGKEQDFEHSIPLDEALRKSFLALSLGGQPLAAIHGGPVRLVTPGYYGTMHVKWLSALRFTGQESDHTSQIPNYRTPRTPIKPGEPFRFTFANSEPNWRMKLKCVVLSPAPGAKLAGRKVDVRGVTFNDGEVRIEAVMVSPDAGRTWQRALLDVPPSKSPYAWYTWQASLALPPGKHQIWALAIDALGRSQPMDGAIGWNPQGYAWNGVEKIDVTVAG